MSEWFFFHNFFTTLNTVHFKMHSNFLFRICLAQHKNISNEAISCVEGNSKIMHILR